MKREGERRRSGFRKWASRGRAAMIRLEAAAMQLKKKKKKKKKKKLSEEE